MQEVYRCVPRFIEKENTMAQLPIHGINVGLNGPNTDTNYMKLEPKKDDSVREILKERGSRYGAYNKHAILTQQMLVPLMRHKNWDELPDHMKETIHMVCHKFGRIINGNPFYLDSWVDIIGYVQLSIDEIEKYIEEKEKDKEKF